MSTLSVRAPGPITLGGSTVYPDTNSCFVCTPPYGHSREWLPNPDTPGRARTLVVCFDGTGDSFDQDNSNVVQFLAMLKKDDPSKQLVYYQAGIGTYTGSSVIGTPIIQATSKLLDQMVAWNLPSHIKDGYLFLMQNYHAGDQISIFGFSRGAFTARALAGMLQKVGLLPPCNIEQLPFAYSMYAREDAEGINLSQQFKRTFSVDVKIQFLGVWDTVQSVGLIPKHLPFSGSNNAIVNFRHALALDERRVKFLPSFCTGGLKLEEAGTKASDPNHHHKADKRHGSGEQLDYETRVNAMTGPDTNVAEVFFSGAHCDVGGGSVDNNEPHTLARIPLRWMIRECYKLNTGIIFDAHMLKYEVGMDVDSLQAPFKPPTQVLPQGQSLKLPGSGEKQGFTLSRSIPVAIYSGITLPFRWSWNKVTHLRYHKIVPPPPPRDDTQFKGEGHEELEDALCPIYDQLHLHWYWKVMEYIPWIIKKQSAEIADSDEGWAYRWIWNRRKGRQVYHLVMERRMKVHRSVKARMLARGRDGDGKQYLPKIRITVNGKPKRLTREEWLAEPPAHFDWVD